MSRREARKSPPDVDAIVVRRAKAGETFMQIGRDLGVSREWVRQVAMRNGLTGRQLDRSRRDRVSLARVAAVLELAEDRPDATIGELARASGMPVGRVAEILGPEEEARRKKPSANAGRRVPDHEVFAEMRRVAGLPGGTPLSAPFWDRHRSGCLTGARLAQRHGSWTEACLAAGVEPRKSTRGEYWRRWTEQDLLRLLADYLGSGGRPSYAAFQRWLRGVKGAPSAQTVRNQLGGSWPDVLRRGVEELARARDTA